MGTSDLLWDLKLNFNTLDKEEKYFPFLQRLSYGFFSSQMTISKVLKNVGSSLSCLILPAKKNRHRQTNRPPPGGNPILAKKTLNKGVYSGEGKHNLRRKLIFLST